MNALLILTIIVVALVLISICLASVLKKEKAKLDASYKVIKTQEVNIDELVSNAVESNKNKVAKSEDEKKVKEAKSDEQVKAVIDSVVDANNKRVQKSSTGKSSTTTKASKTRTKKA